MEDTFLGVFTKILKEYNPSCTIDFSSSYLKRKQKQKQILFVWAVFTSWERQVMGAKQVSKNGLYLFCTSCMIPKSSTSWRQVMIHSFGTTRCAGHRQEQNSSM